MLEVNNGPNNRFPVKTGGHGGFYRVCGLGASTWTIVLFYVPGTPIGNQPRATFVVNGSRRQEAAVNFVKQ